MKKFQITKYKGVDVLIYILLFLVIMFTIGYISGVGHAFIKDIFGR